MDNKEDFLEQVEKENEKIEKILNIQKDKKTIIFEECNIIIMNSLRTHLTEWEKLLNQSIEISEKIKKNIEDLEILQKNIYGIREYLIEIIAKKLKNEEYENEVNKTKEDYKKYEKLKIEIIEKVLNDTIEIEDFSRIVVSTIKKNIYKEDIVNATKTNIQQKENIVKITEYKEESDLPNTENKIKNITEKNLSENKQNELEKDGKIQDNKTLLISEKTNKVYLPYLVKDLKQELNNNKKYKTLEELIKNEYILDLDIFKNSMKARFKETYKLIKKKEKGSIIDATQLGIELMFNYSLNPAIIAACKNEDELDIYLDCLEENELEAFNIFDVKYEIAPVLIKNK